MRKNFIEIKFFKNKRTIIILFIILYLAMVELYLQIIDFPEQELNLSTVLHNYSLNQELLYELKPNFEVFVENISYTTNTFGGRGRNFSFDKQDNARICVVGDSVMFGMFLKNEETFSSILEKKARFPSLREI